jgi:predicted enzyme related to lactoylglutathione lyase
MVATVFLEHIGVPGGTLQFGETIRFYEEVLGWRKIREANEGKTIFLSDGRGGTLELAKRDGSGITAPCHLAFVVPAVDFEAMYEHLAGHGVGFTKPVAQTSDGGKQVFFEDPAGNTCQLVGRMIEIKSHW